MAARDEALNRAAALLRDERRRYAWLAADQREDPQRRTLYQRISTAKLALAALLPPARDVAAERPPTAPLMINAPSSPQLAAAEDRLVRLIEQALAAGEDPALRAALKRYVPQVEACRLALARREAGPTPASGSGGSASGTQPFGHWLRLHRRRGAHQA